jgi:predicted RNA-binding Zn ribbon-like protein
LLTCVFVIAGYHFTNCQITCKDDLEGYQKFVTKPFELVAAHPALDLVNTLDWRFRESGSEELLPSYVELLRFVEESALLTPRQSRLLRRTTSERAATQALHSTLDLREAAAEIFYVIVDERIPPKGAIKKLDRQLRIAQANRMLNWTNLGLELTWINEADPHLPLWLLTQSAADLLTSAAAQSIRACADPGCRWLFLDTSKNHSRRWCDMKICGNRMKARRFKAQHSG